ncbi:outer mitochondrial transmembrane helix translocase-like [Eupeodes corollae]|uniref:outer mitochondrial transmembrane helix translocase-like n=1 Tax=Eupeodes corollae TaxID=290404 RepID=UPI002491DD8C|nr:outer mitochondrial transmembrane helix translocase-like [Eupeodes corollae]
MSDFGFGGSQMGRNEIFQLVLRVSVASVVTYFSLKWMMKQLDPTSKNKRNAKIRAEEQLKRIQKASNFGINTQVLNDYELMIASHLVVPDDIPISWNDIAGLDGVIQELRESVVLPVRHRDLFSKSKLWEAPKGVLLHGPPGCGKTLIAKATAKEAGMRFINLDVAILTDKWYGESQKLASAVFSLAVKLQPCIIFIDEIDSFLRTRTSNDHEATAMMKTQFMMLWDGLSTQSGSSVIVMGATNRPQDLDKAILRRMPAQFHIGLPTDAQRLQILKLVLETENISDSINFNQLSKLTKGFSGSDLREMCRNASVYRMRTFMRDNEKAIDSANGDSELLAGASTSSNDNLLAISMDDMLKSYERMKESKKHTQNIFVENHIDLD